MGRSEIPRRVADSHFRFFSAFARGILGGVLSGPAMAATSIGVTAPGFVAPTPWAVAQQPAAAAGHQGAVPSLHALLAHGTVLGPSGSLPPAQPLAQNQQPGAALWSTIPPLATQIGGPASSAAAPNPAEAARAALFMSQLAAMQVATHAAMPPSLTIPPPAYVAPRAEGVPARQPRSTAQATAALNRNELWIPYLTSTLGSHSPYPTFGRLKCSLLQNFQNCCRSAGFSPLTCSPFQQEIQEEEEVQLASVQVASEKQATQHGPLPRKNVEGVKPETAHCLKLGQTLRMQCKTAISEVFQGFSWTNFFFTACASSESSR